MLSSGNGTPQVCVHNLMRLHQYEVPYDRLRGMDARLIDKNVPILQAEIVNHAAWLIENYEPRVTLTDSNTVTDLETENEIINLNIDLKEN